MGRRQRKEKRAAGGERLPRWANWATIVAVPIAIVAAVLAIVAPAGDSPVEPQTPATPVSRPAVKPPREAVSSPEPPPQLERVDLIVRNGPLPRHPKLELIVHNVGRGRAIASRARIEIRRKYLLPLCFTQGGFSLSGEYNAEIPAAADPGYVVETPLHQQVAPGQPDRFEIALGVAPDPSPDFFGLYMYELRVSLLHDGEARPLPMGDALVSIPGIPDAESYYLTAGGFAKLDAVFNPGESPDYWAQAKPCWRSNTRALRRALAGAATRSPSLNAVGARMVTPDFSASGG